MPPAPGYISMFSRSPEEKKCFLVTVFFKLTSGYVNQTQADDFTSTIVSISIVQLQEQLNDPWVLLHQAFS